MPRTYSDTHGRKLVFFALTTALVFLVLFGGSGKWAVAQAPGVNQVGANLAMGAPAGEALEGRDCASGISIRIEFGHLCTSVCETNVECLDGWGCKVIEQGNGEPIGLCVPRRISMQSPAP